MPQSPIRIPATSQVATMPTPISRNEATAAATVTAPAMTHREMGLSTRKGIVWLLRSSPRAAVLRTIEAIG